MRRILSVILPALCVLFISLSHAQEPTNIETLREKVEQYYHSGAYMHDAEGVINKARSYIRLQMKRLHNKQKKLAIVLDIDETCLSNYTKLEARGFTGDLEAIHREIIEGGSPAITPMLTLYKEAREQGVAVFFVTGRVESEKSATIENLKEAGYKKWAGLYMCPNQYNQRSIVSFKSHARRKITDLGYTIIASIGDQESDITGGYALRGFKLPNPYYYVP